MRVFMISRGVPTKEAPLNGIFEFDQAKGLAKAGIDVILCAVDLRSIRHIRKFGFSKYRKDGVVIYEINAPIGRIKRKFLSKIYQFYIRMIYKKVIKDFGEPDLIHSHFIDLGFNMVSVFKESSIPLILTEHSSKFNEQSIDATTFNMAKFTYNKLDALICVSGSLADNIYDHFGVESIIIPNIIDFSEFPLSEKIEADGLFSFISVGRLEKLKGMDQLILAFIQAFENDPNISLNIIGDGSQKKELLEIINDNKMEEAIKIIGAVPRHIIKKYMATSDAFVLASPKETFGLAYAEALSSGLPVIGIENSGGPQDFINHQNGILVPYDNIKKLSESMIYIKNNIEKFDRRAISEDIKLKFSEKTILDKIINVYQENIKDETIE